MSKSDRNIFIFILFFIDFIKNFFIKITYDQIQEYHLTGKNSNTKLLNLGNYQSNFQNLFRLILINFPFAFHDEEGKIFLVFYQIKSGFLHYLYEEYWSIINIPGIFLQQYASLLGIF